MKRPHEKPGWVLHEWWPRDNCEICRICGMTLKQLVEWEEKGGIMTKEDEIKEIRNQHLDSRVMFNNKIIKHDVDKDLVEMAKERYLRDIVFDPGKNMVESNVMVLVRFAQEVRDSQRDKNKADIEIMPYLKKKVMDTAKELESERRHADELVEVLKLFENQPCSCRLIPGSAGAVRKCDWCFTREALESHRKRRRHDL